MYTDAHTHLNSDTLYPDRQDHLIHFYQVGGRVLICIGTHDERNHRAIQISTDSSTLNLDSLVVKATVGIHPGEVCSGKIRSTEEIDNEIILLTKLLDSYPQQIVAIGECGIDAHYDGFDQTAELQSHLFHKQCQLADQYDLPVVIHSRDQFDLTLAVVSEFPDVKFYFHCWGYTPHELQQLEKLDRQLRVGFCGNTTYPSAHQLRESVQYVRDSHTHTGAFHLLLETDAPYLAPQHYRGQINTPDKITALYLYLSQLLDAEKDYLIDKVAQAAQLIYQL